MRAELMSMCRARAVWSDVLGCAGRAAMMESIAMSVVSATAMSALEAVSCTTTDGTRQYLVIRREGKDRDGRYAACSVYSCSYTAHAVWEMVFETCPCRPPST